MRSPHVLPGRSFQRILSTSLVVCHVLSILTTAVSEEIPHEGSPRIECIRQFQKMNIPEQLAMDYLKEDVFTIFQRNRESIIMRFSSSRTDLRLRYKNACEKDGQGNFTEFTGILDCEKQIDEKHTHEQLVYETKGVCFPTGSECLQFVTHPEDWQIAGLAATSNCSLLSNVTPSDFYAQVISLTANHLPAGEPHFVKNPPRYNQHAQATCQKAYSKILRENEELTDELFHELALTNIALLQVEPILTQIEYNIASPSQTEYYRELCQKEVHGKFIHLSYASMDCVNTGKYGIQGEKKTIVLANLTRCFPTPACSGYTLGQWVVDTHMNTAGLSCSIRTEGYQEDVLGDATDKSEDMPVDKPKAGPSDKHSDQPVETIDPAPMPTKSDSSATKKSGNTIKGHKGLVIFAFFGVILITVTYRTGSSWNQRQSRHQLLPTQEMEMAPVYVAQEDNHLALIESNGSQLQ